jgi:4-amino-4-deoxy-L-arabinose transferase-like glycosyltransferase
MIRKIDKKLLFILLLATLIRLWFIFSSDYISPDGTHYASLGYNLVHEFKYESNGSQFPDIIQPPLYPFLLGLFSLIFPAMLAGKFVSLVFGLLLIFLVYHFVKKIKPDGNWANYAALLTAVHPGLIAVSSQVATESLYLFLMMAIFTQGWYFIERPSFKKITILGLLFVITFLTRPEAILFFIIFLFIQIYQTFKKSIPAKFLFTHLAIFVIGAGLYGVSVAQELGYFTISPKINYVRAQGKFQAHQKRLMEKSGQKLGAKEIGLRARYALSADSSMLATQALLYKDPATIALMKSSKNNGAVKGGGFSKLIKYIFYNLKLVAFRLVKGIVTPPVYLLLFLIGMVTLRKSFKANTGLLLYGFLMTAPLSAYLVTHMEERFLYLILPYGILFFAAGAVALDLILKKIIKNENLLFWAIAVLIFITLIPSYTQTLKKMQQKDYYSQLANKISELVEKDSKIAAVVPQATFFSGLKYCPVPFASLQGLDVYLKLQKADYLLVEGADFNKRPLLEKIVEAEPTLFVEVGHGTVSDKKYWLYKIHTF